ncbi:MAG: hypothetical protein AAF204_02525 [Pseudomonadota bacterium]
MSYSNIVSDEAYEFLIAEEGEKTYEIIKAEEEPNSQGHFIVVGIKRSQSDPEEFLFSLIDEIDTNTLESRPHSVFEFLEQLKLDPKKYNVPVLDGFHIGPLSRTKSMEFLELVHACFWADYLDFQLKLTRKKFIAPERPAIQSEQNGPSNLLNFPRPD